MKSASSMIAPTSISSISILDIKSFKSFCASITFAIKSSLWPTVILAIISSSMLALRASIASASPSAAFLISSRWSSTKWLEIKSGSTSSTSERACFIWYIASEYSWLSLLLLVIISFQSSNPSARASIPLFIRYISTDKSAALSAFVASCSLTPPASSENSMRFRAYSFIISASSSLSPKLSAAFLKKSSIPSSSVAATILSIALVNSSIVIFPLSSSCAAALNFLRFSTSPQSIEVNLLAILSIASVLVPADVTILSNTASTLSLLIFDNACSNCKCKLSRFIKVSVLSEPISTLVNTWPRFSCNFWCTIVSNSSFE